MPHMGGRPCPDHCPGEGGVLLPALAAVALAGLLLWALSALTGVFEAVAVSILALCEVAAVVTAWVVSRRRLPRPQFSEWVEARTSRQRVARPEVQPLAALTRGPLAIEAAPLRVVEGAIIKPGERIAR